MVLPINTFDNKSRAGDPLFKALGHPALTSQINDWIDKAKKIGPLAVIDPWGQFSCLDALYDLSGLSIVGRFVQRYEDLADNGKGKWPVRPLTDLGSSNAKTALLAAFDADQIKRAVEPLLRPDMPIISFDDMRLDKLKLTNQRRYLDPVNFATNLSLFRANEQRHSIVRMVEYWSGYGAQESKLWLILFDAEGKRLADWTMPLNHRQSIVIDADEVRHRFNLKPFEGMLFMHAVGIAGHDQIKYVLDDVDAEGKDPAVTHDSNSWPAQLYAGLPGPKAGDKVILWLQNSHPKPVPPGSISIAPMGVMRHEEGSAGLANATALQQEIPGFGTYACNVTSLFPDHKWPTQFEVSTGQHVVRPRYEIIRDGHVTFAHMNVERTDLKPDPEITRAAPLIGKGYILPAPILPMDRWRTLALLTPAATGQSKLPLSLLIYSKDGALVFEKALGVLARSDMPALDINELLTEMRVKDPKFEGHLEFMYDFSHGIDVDGWLHGLFRYEDLQSGQVGDTSFGAHVFNIPVTFKDEPQSYAGRPPGLSTRLFARLMQAPLDAFVHLTYPSSGSWRPQSDTTLTLYDPDGNALAEHTVAIPLNGSRLLMSSQLFSVDALTQATEHGYIIISDRTCRLFGYHGVVGPDGQFALDHMFGF